MVRIRIKNKTLLVPETGNEWSRRQLVGMAKVLFVAPPAQATPTTEGESSVIMPMRVLKILLGFGWWKWFKWVDEWVIEKYLYLTQYVLAGEWGITKQLIPRYKVFFGKKLYGPADCFDNVIMDEFVYCEHYYSEWDKDRNNERLLDSLIAILYRQKKKGYNFRLNADGDCRVPFNEYECSYRAKKTVSRWPRKIKYAILMWYIGCRAKMVTDNPDVFGSDGGEAAKYGLISIIRSIAKDGTHGNFEEVGKKYLSLIMIELNETVAEAKKMEEAYKKT